ncbi:MAG: HAMP domain-containing histidine kinase [Elusimicrobia bacterium]|nr:HAMP domain-containing histidine kinase [Elusimicrobiota bacterium]
MMRWFVGIDRRSELLLKLVHDLRNPLTCIDSFSKLLLESPKNNSRDQERETLKRISFCSQLALGLLGDLMDQQSIEKGKFRLNHSPVILEDLLRQVVQSFEIVCQTKGLSLQLEPMQSNTPVEADARRILQVLSNLLANAVRHTPKGGVLSVGMAREGMKVKVCVKDTGDGVPLEEQKKIFQKFYSSGKNSGGLGLGLNICREIVVRHGGDIGVMSAGAGKGSCFFFTLPLEALPEAQGAPKKEWRWIYAGGAVAAALLLGFFMFQKHQSVSMRHGSTQILSVVKGENLRDAVAGNFPHPESGQPWVWGVGTIFSVFFLVLFLSWFKSGRHSMGPIEDAKTLRHRDIPYDL